MLVTGGRARQVVRARKIIAYVAGRYLGRAGKELADALGVSPTAVSRGIANGEKELDDLGWDVEGLIDKRN